MAFLFCLIAAAQWNDLLASSSATTVARRNSLAGGGKRRTLDCLVINDRLARLKERGIEYDTVRGAFLEGEPVYPGAGFGRETHIQLAVRNSACILGVFRPNLKI
ncbi:MAG TPA: hypothetical protein VMV69_12005 [Pirellulales bacterium]|nr:hypothetical protein [Pirellulales bacterium]